MLDVNKALDSCLMALSNEYDIQEVDYIPVIGLDIKPSVRIWKVIKPALLKGRAEYIEMYLQFPDDFPYSMPCVYIPDDRFKYLPHISVDTRKLCLYEDDEAYDAKNILGLIRNNLNRARRWVEEYYGRDNNEEYAKEINSYWNEKYEGENCVDNYWAFSGQWPTNTCELKGFSYEIRDYKNEKSYVMSVVSYAADDPLLEYITNNHATVEFPVLFLASVYIPMHPPFNMTGEDLINRITDVKDKLLFKRFINNYGYGYILFEIGLNYALGGVHIKRLLVNRKGYRPGVLTSFHVLTAFENKKRKLGRLFVPWYSENRIAERTYGKMMEERKIIVAGVGSVGSNLCYYLNGYNNIKFTLVDSDVLTIENIGRHLLGYNDVGQLKSNAVAQYLQRYRPDREVRIINKNIQQLDAVDINNTDAIFVCTGNLMSERWLLDKINESVIVIPSFILWLEPYGISGIMIYVNPNEKESICKLMEKANNGFLDYCLIHRDEYASSDKFVHRDAGCNGGYSLYSANDVTLFLSAMFPIIDQLLFKPTNTKCYRWVGNVNIAKERGIKLVLSSDLSKNMVQEMEV